MQRSKIAFISFLLVLLVGVAACRKHYTPKPKGYPRIDLPAHAYASYRSDCSFRFDLPIYATIAHDSSRLAEPCWLNIDYPSLRARIHLSYKDVNHNLGKLMEDSRNFVYSHVSKADAIDETLLNFPKHKVYGILYDLSGNAASSLQFVVTDSTHHFMRGALYFYMEPNYDSLAPAIVFIRADMMRLIESLEWSK